MKLLIAASLVSLGLALGSTAFADDLKKIESGKDQGQPLNSQVVDTGDRKIEAKADNASEPKRPFHFVGHSE